MKIRHATNDISTDTDTSASHRDHRTSVQIVAFRNDKLKLN